MRYLLFILLFACNQSSRPVNNNPGTEPIVIVPNEPVILPIDTITVNVSRKPETLKWKDRRPIGMVMLASYAEPHADGKYNWKLGGQMQFSKDALFAHLNESLRNLKEINAQGVVLWDIEGQRYPHAISYIGDPRLAPLEIDTLLDEAFKLFADQGIKVGVTLRPDTLILANGWAYHYTVANPLQNLIDKIIYAKKRWDCTLFYVDSNVGEGLPVNADNTVGSGQLMPYTIFQALSKLFPDCLIMPEHQDNNYYKYSAPYNDKNYRATLTSDEKGFQVLMVDGFNQDQLTESVKQGNILLGRVWYLSDDINLIKIAYERSNISIKD